MVLPFREDGHGRAVEVDQCVQFFRDPRVDLSDIPVRGDDPVHPFDRTKPGDQSLELVFQTLLFCRLQNGDDHAGRDPSFSGDTGDRNPAVDLSPGLRIQPIFLRNRLSGSHRAYHSVDDFRGDGEELVDGGPDHLVPGPAEEEFGGVVPQPDDSLEVGEEDHDAGRLQDGNPLVRFPPGAPFLLGGEGDSRDGIRVPGEASPLREVGPEPARSSIGAPEREFPNRFFVLPEGRAEEFQRLHPVGGQAGCEKFRIGQKVPAIEPGKGLHPVCYGE